MQVFIVVPILFALGLASARACSCAHADEICRSVRHADIVFRGTPSHERRETVDSHGVRVFDFVVAEVFKGPSTGRIAVHTALHSGACGVDFIANVEYLVFASGGPDGRLYTNLCAGNVRSSHSDLDDLCLQHPSWAAGPYGEIRSAGIAAPLVTWAVVLVAGACVTARWGVRRRMGSHFR